VAVFEYGGEHGFAIRQPPAGILHRR
jgi:hypothetical protein